MRNKPSAASALPRIYGVSRLTPEDPKKLFGIDTGKIKQAFQNWQAQLVTILADGTLTPQDSLEQRLASIESCMVQLKDSFN